MSAKKNFNMLLAAVLCFAVAAFGFTSKESAEMKRAKTLFDAGKLDEALTVYEDIMRANPASDIAHFNVGLMMYNKKEFIKAIESFQKALATADKTLERDALGFIGNSYFNLAEEVEKTSDTLAAKSFREALWYYRKAMETDNEDKDIRYNYELAKKRLYHLADMGGVAGKDMLRQSISVLMQEDREFAAARQKDIEHREEDSRIERTRREEDAAKREARKNEDRRIDETRRRENEARARTEVTVQAPETAGPLENIAAREEARRAEDAAREESRRREDAETETRRSREDDEREEARRGGAAGGIVVGAQSADGGAARSVAGWLAGTFGCGTAWAEETVDAGMTDRPAPDQKIAAAAGPGFTAIYSKRRIEDNDRESSRRSEDDERESSRRLEDAGEYSVRRIEDLDAAPEAPKPDIPLQREKKDLEKELKRLKEDRVIYIKRKKEDIKVMMERAKEDARAEEALRDRLERASIMSEEGGGEASAMAQSAASRAAAMEEAAAMGAKSIMMLESEEAKGVGQGQEGSGGVSEGGASSGSVSEGGAGAGGGAGSAGAAGAGGAEAGGGAGSGESISQQISRLKQSIAQEQQIMQQSMSIAGREEIDSEITGKLAPGKGHKSQGGRAPKTPRSALEELEDALAKRAKEEGDKGKKNKDDDAAEKIKGNDAELLLDTYWMGEAPKKAIEREKSPDYSKDEKNW